MNVSNQSFRRRQKPLISKSSKTSISRGLSCRTKRGNTALIGLLDSAPATTTTTKATTTAASNTTAFVIPTTNHHATSNPSDQLLFFKGVVACLSGQTEDEKSRLHTIVQKFGGSIMGHFDPKYITHLILDAPVGSKYLNWRRHLEIYRQKNNNVRCNDDNKDEIQASAWAEKLIVVTTSWIEACQRESRRVPEDGFPLSTTVDNHDEGDDNGTGRALFRVDKLTTKTTTKPSDSPSYSKKQQIYPEEIVNQRSTPEERCTYIIDNILPNEYCNLFLGQSFLLVGFDCRNGNCYDASNDSHGDKGSYGHGDNLDDENDSMIPTYGGAISKTTNSEISNTNVDGDGVVTGLVNNRALSRRIHCDHQPRLIEDTNRPLIMLLSKLIRRAGGTIFWEPNEWISIVLLHDFYSKRMWDEVRYFCRDHPKGPICVTVDWILSSIFHRAGKNMANILAPPFPTEPKQHAMKIKTYSVGRVGGDSGESSSIGISSENATGRVTESNGKTVQSCNTTSSVFRGDVFAVYVSKSTTNTVAFRKEDMESTITGNGGLLLSKTLLLAMKNDAKKSILSNNNRGYYVVSNILVQTDCSSPVPLLAELTKVGIKVVPVSLVWISACVMNDQKYDPAEYPLLFQPQPWPIRCLSQLTSSDNRGKKNRFLISVTGFVDSSRYGIISMLHEIGADFTENLTRGNTHLICKEGRGLKYDKALEWGLHVVTIEWLYHIIRYGFHDGSENKFRLGSF